MANSFARALLTAVLISSGATSAMAAPASQATQARHEEWMRTLPLHDTQDFEDARRGLIHREPSLLIKGEAGNVVWDLDSYKSFVTPDSDAPPTVHPGLWRMSQLNLLDGLYKVTENIYQVRGYDLSNITFVRGQTGWIVFDVGTSTETAAAAFALIRKHVDSAPIKAVIYSHSHIDHYAGVKGVIDQKAVDAGEVEVIAPKGFFEHAISEGVIAGNAMKRRATYMYGAFLPRGPEHGVGSGLGMTNPLGTISLIAPTRSVSTTGETLVVDGVEMVMQLTPGTEAPVEMNTYLPQFKAMWMAENTTNTMHNILSLRGTQVRDARQWAHYINETMDLFGDRIEVKFQAHHWPVWGKERVHDYLTKQRDLYKYTHDRTVNLMNKGYTGEEIADLIELPKSLRDHWPARGYYGTLKHNARAVYQYYMGWYDAHPSSLDVLPPEQAAHKYVEYIGRDNLLKRAQQDYEQGEYRWVAMVLKHAVFADPQDQQARLLLAAAYEQLGYQAESGPWRSIYLQGALELRHGAPNLPQPVNNNADMIAALTPEMLFDLMAVRLNEDKAKDRTLAVAFRLTDLNRTYTVTLGNSVLNYSIDSDVPAEATVEITQSDFKLIQAKALDWQSALQSGRAKILGSAPKLMEFAGLFEEPQLWFNVVSP
ncbi:MAG TPA: alkyl sulfatase dimerization domain-containing protein [Pusillimonas sp.]|uniref:alkyl/aryl-sulfatase n=1 Tax=Pusillimonas sp. TaxID=3040095 RepID=UPI002BAD5E24|nr:alkyl sulfatase dimerization domain-containing protein [Pusillimonas sp.]HUH87470.1 alkyl sulfatase dimerization domain-containing protein [Pusillimonas sp.]